MNVIDVYVYICMYQGICHVHEVIQADSGLNGLFGIIPHAYDRLGLKVTKKKFWKMTIIRYSHV